MNLKNRENKENEWGILSTTKPKNNILSINKKQSELKTNLRQMKKIIVYKKDEKYFVEHATAFALGLINTRSIMFDKPKLVEISYDIHNKLCQNEEIEIEYSLLKNEKEKLKVFINSSSYCIETGAAYALGLLTVEEFNNSTENYYYINESMLNDFREKYEVEIYALNLYEEIKKNK